MHKVTLRKGFTGERRNRAGISVSRTEPVIVELDEEQLAAIKADPELVVEKAKQEDDVDQDNTRSMVDKPKTKKELLAEAEAEGLTLEGITSKNKVDEIVAAIEAARGTQDEGDTTDEEG